MAGQSQCSPVATGSNQKNCGSVRMPNLTERAVCKRLAGMHQITSLANPLSV